MVLRPLGLGVDSGIGIGIGIDNVLGRLASRIQRRLDRGFELPDLRFLERCRLARSVLRRLHGRPDQRRSGPHVDGRQLDCSLERVAPYLFERVVRQLDRSLELLRVGLDERDDRQLGAWGLGSGLGSRLRRLAW